MDRIDALRLFCSVAELGSFTKAAEREAGRGGDAGGLGGIGSASMRADEVYIEASRV